MDQKAASVVTTPEQLEEYRALRAEALLHIDHARKGQMFCVLATVSILSYAIANKQPWLCMLGWLIVFYFWRAYRNDMTAVHKIAQYVATFLEKEPSGLFWEHRIAQVDPPTAPDITLSHHRKKALRFFAYLTVPHAVLSIATILTGISLTFRKWDSDSSIILISLFLIVAIVIHSWLWIAIAMRQNNGGREYWATVFRTLRDREKCSNEDHV